jgi:predicted AAA+ superfamily ATPase
MIDNHLIEPTQSIRSLAAWPGRRADGRVIAIEVKLTRDIGEEHTRHLSWLANQLGDTLLDAIVITTGEHAYRRRDGIAVIPAALLGP